MCVTVVFTTKGLQYPIQPINSQVSVLTQIYICSWVFTYMFCSSKGPSSGISV